MRSKLTLSTVALVATGAIPVHADQAAGNTCAAGLTGDGKQIYAAALARNPDKNNIKRTMEVVVSELAQAGKITRGVTARDNGGAAAQCVAAALR